MDLGKAQLKPLVFLLQFLKVGVLVRQSEMSFLSHLDGVPSYKNKNS